MYERTEIARQQLQQTQITQPALFVIEYALAKLWMSWGISPVAMIGHSIGEYVAACLAGVFSLEDALTLVAVRGRLMQQLPKGAMLSVELDQEAIQFCLNEKLCLAVINAPTNCVVSGTESAIEELQQELQLAGVNCRRLHTSHAFHSAMMDSILGIFTEEVKKVNLNPPEIPFISNLTGGWITPSEATDPSYWTKHLRHTVRFSTGIAELIKDFEQVLLEVGPGRTLNTLAKQQTKDAIILSSMRHPKDEQSDVAFLLNSLGRLWLAGVQVNWFGFYAQEQRHRIPLPTYPFERQRYWIEPQKINDTIDNQAISKKQNIADWFYLPSWKQVNLLEPFKPREIEKAKLCYLVFVDSCNFSLQIAQQLEQKGQEVITVTVGEKFTQLSDHAYAINPEQEDDYDILFQTLGEIDKVPQTIAHFWGVTANTQNLSQTFSEQIQSAISSFQQYQNFGFYSTLSIAKALSKRNITKPLELVVVTNNVHNTSGQEELIPEKGTVLGACKVISQEYPNITCRNIDIIISELKNSSETQLINQIMAELTTQPSDLVVAYRGSHRWVQTTEPKQLKQVEEETTRLREGGIYLIAGDFIGSLGLVFAEYLAQTLQVKLILIGNIGLPRRDEWSQWLTNHGEQDIVSSYIKKILGLEESGTELLMIEADPANIEQMQTAINQAYESFERIHGVFYVTPMSDEKSSFSIQEIGRDQSELQFHSKVYGLYVLEKLLQDRELDFCLLQSSLSSIVGGLGLVAYSAANLFIDSFVVKKNHKNIVPWFCINWDAVRYQQQERKDGAPETSLIDLAMTPNEAWEVCQRVLAIASPSQFIVSPGDLQARISTWIERKSLHKRNNSQEDLLSQHSRPNLQTVYTAPSNEIEQRVAQIWQEIIGVEQIGVNDNFFELGGHSLLAVQVTSRLREIFEVELPLESILFDAPTLAGIAKVIAQKQRRQEDEEIQETADLLQKVRSLSLSEIQQELVTDSE
ncbi:MAG: acyltransferase domain-containing protein [Richelia sp. RM2_1_2]|nr:acyltransferase domain-containing protein [Richelia sp. RM2_1_2]